MNIFKKLLPLLVLLLLSFWAVRPLFNPGFFPMHDDTQVARIFEMKKSLSDGMFPVRWVADLGYGYGYPIFNFYAPLAYYIGGIFNLIGFNPLIATKIMMGIGIIAAGLFMYLFAREFWGEKGGIVSGLLYLYAPYHALDIYVRGDVAEFWAYAFIPLAFLAIYKVFTGLQAYIGLEQSAKLKAQNSKNWHWVCLVAVSYAAIILSHNLTAMMVTPFIFMFAIILYFRLRMEEKIYKPYFVLLGLLFGIVLSAFYWLPVFPELSFTNVLSVVGGGSDYKDHFVCLQQLWSSPWGFGGSAPGCIDGLSFKIGKIHILFSLLSAAALIPMYKKNKTKFIIMIFSNSILLLLVFLTLNQSKFIWDAIAHMAFFQFPWRFLLLISFFLSFLGGAILWVLKDLTYLRYKYVRFLIFVFCAVSIIVLNSELFAPQRFINKNLKDYTSKYTLNWEISKISDEYMPKDFARPMNPSEVPSSRFKTNQDIKISKLKEKTQHIEFVADAKAKTDLVVNLAYFPGWHVFIDNKQVWFSYFNKGLIIKLPKGKHKVDLVFQQTLMQHVGNATSAAGVICLLIGIITQRRKNKYYG